MRVFVAAAALVALCAAAKVEHVVVLVLENRSFDHMVSGRGSRLCCLCPFVLCEPWRHASYTARRCAGGLHGRR
jgi:hypothetical protein